MSGIPFKVLLFDDLVGILTSGYVTKMVVKLFYLVWPKPPPLLYANFTALSSVGLEFANRSFALQR